MSMKEEYRRWHTKKSEIDEESKRVYFHEREVWFCHLGKNIGFEQDGNGDNFGRPVVVFRKFNNEVFWAIPITTKDKKGKFYIKVDLGDRIHRLAILSQLRLLDGKRLYQKIGVISETTHKFLERRLINLCKGS